jgi:hypothetical protein
VGSGTEITEISVGTQPKRTGKGEEEDQREVEDRILRQVKQLNRLTLRALQAEETKQVNKLVMRITTNLLASDSISLT